MALTALFLILALALAAEPETLTLDEALQRLDARNTTIAEARARVDEAQGVVRMAAAAIQPIVGAKGSYTRNSHSAQFSISDAFGSIQQAIEDMGLPLTIDTSGLPDDIIIQPEEQWMGAGSVQVPLVVANAWADLAAARRAVDAAEASSEAVALKVEGAVVQACWMADAAEHFVEVAERAADTSRAHRDSAQRQLDAGVVTRLDVLRADTELARRESELAQARAELDKARLALGAALGEDGPVRVAMPAVAEGTGAPGAALVDRALAERPELAARRAAVEANEKQLLSARLRVLPTLGGSFSYFASDVPYPTGEKWGWKANIELTWALWDGGFRYGKAHQAEGALAGARAALEGQERQVSLEVENALRDLDVARERLDLAATRLLLAREAQASASRGYEAGLVDSLQVLDASDALALAEVAQVEAQARLGVAEAQLRAATGQGW